MSWVQKEQLLRANLGHWLFWLRVLPNDCDDTFSEGWGIGPCVALSMPGRQRQQLLSLTLNRQHTEKFQWTFMAWFKICDSVFINFSSLWTGAKMLLLCLDFYISIAIRLQTGNLCRQLDFHTPGIFAFTFFLVLRFRCHSSVKYVFYFAHFCNDWFILSIQLASKIKGNGGRNWSGLWN